MKYHFIIIFTAILFGCSNKELKKGELYNPKAVELNDKAVRYIISNSDSALILLNMAIDYDSSYYLPHSNKVTIYLDQSNYYKALLESKLVNKKKSDLAEGWTFTGFLNLYLENEEDANQCFKRSIELYTNRIENLSDTDEIDNNLLNRALAKKFTDDKSYMKDLNDIRNQEQLKSLITDVKSKSKEKLLKELIN
jgi:hypothetical protein